MLVYYFYDIQCFNCNEIESEQCEILVAALDKVSPVINVIFLY